MNRSHTTSSLVIRSPVDSKFPVLYYLKFLPALRICVALLYDSGTWYGFCGLPARISRATQI